MQIRIWPLGEAVARPAALRSRALLDHTASKRFQDDRFQRWSAAFTFRVVTDTLSACIRPAHLLGQESRAARSETADRVHPAQVHLPRSRNSRCGFLLLFLRFARRASAVTIAVGIAIARCGRWLQERVRTLQRRPAAATVSRRCHHAHRWRASRRPCAARRWLNTSSSSLAVELHLFTSRDNTLILLT